jgi:hypothetical protein
MTICPAGLVQIVVRIIPTIMMIGQAMAATILAVSLVGILAQFLRLQPEM